jgi:VWFA-related protein
MQRPWILALVLPCVLGAQTPSAPVIKSTSSEVVVDFVAHDKHGAIVRDLQPEEVRVFEDGAPQQLRSLTFFESGLPLPAQPLPAEAAAIRGRQELDNANLVTFVLAGPFTIGTDNGVAARDLLRNFLVAEMHSDTYVGVFMLDHGSLLTVLPYTNDGDAIGPALTAGVSKLSGRQIEDTAPRKAKSAAVFPDPSLSPTVKAAVDHVVARLMRSRLDPDDDASLARASLNLLRLVEAQAELPGRKLLFYVGQGFTPAGGREDLLEAVVSAANRSSVTIYGIDLTRLSVRPELAGARGGFASAYSATTLNLENLATGTGGELIGRTNDLLTPMKRAMEDARSRWEVTYAPSDPREDGRFRKLKVAVSRPGVTVTARSGYYALPTVNGEPIEPYEYAPLMALNSQPGAGISSSTAPPSVTSRGRRLSSPWSSRRRCGTKRSCRMRRRRKAGSRRTSLSSLWSKMRMGAWWAASVKICSRRRRTNRMCHPRWLRGPRRSGCLPAATRWKAPWWTGTAAKRAPAARLFRSSPRRAWR